MSAAPRILLLTRIHRIEMPFMSRFLPHYLDGLGFDHVRFIHADRADADWLEERIRNSGMEGRASVFAPGHFNNANQLLDLSVPDLRRDYDWMVLADMDEYLHLGGRTIGEVLAEHEAHRIVHFRWFMVSTLQQSPAGAAELLADASLFRKRFSKTAFRLDEVTRIDAHEAFWDRPLRDGDKYTYNIRAPVRESCFFYHFCSRGLLDQLLKAAHQRFGARNVKSTRPALLKNFLLRKGDVATVEEIPGRFLLLMLQQQEDQSSQRVVGLARNFGRRLFADYKFDVPMLRDMLARSLKRLDLPRTAANGILDGDTLRTCMETITARFWIEDMRPDLRLENYLAVIKKWTPAMNQKGGA